MIWIDIVLYILLVINAYQELIDDEKRFYAQAGIDLDTDPMAGTGYYNQSSIIGMIIVSLFMAIPLAMINSFKTKISFIAQKKNVLNRTTETISK